MTDTEVVLLAGGASRRMGADKASIEVQGTPLAARVADEARNAGYRVTVMGRAPLPGCEFVPDALEFQGPAAALARFEPSRAHVAVLQCDLARFDARVVALMRGLVEGWEAVAPVVDGQAQPLCALYRAEAFDKLRALTGQGEQRVIAWLSDLRWRSLDPRALEAHGLDPRCVMGANTPGELRSLLEGPDA